MDDAVLKACRVQVWVAYDDGGVLVELDDSVTLGEMEPVVDKDLDAFSKFYEARLKNGPLSKFERAAIKTYLAWKLGPETE
jgi:hypothetical protein